MIFWSFCPQRRNSNSFPWVGVGAHLPPASLPWPVSPSPEVRSAKHRAISSRPTLLFTRISRFSPCSVAMLGACIWGMKETYQEGENQEIAFRGAPRMAGQRRELQRVAGGQRAGPKEVDAVRGSRQSKNPWRGSPGCVPELAGQPGQGCSQGRAPLRPQSLAVVPCFDSTTVHPATRPRTLSPSRLSCSCISPLPDSGSALCRMLYGPGDVIGRPEPALRLKAPAYTHLVCQNNNAAVRGFRPGWVL